MLRVHLFHVGKVIVDRAIVYHEKNPFAVTGIFCGKDKKLTLAVSCHLIEHPKEKILFDTGRQAIRSAKRRNQGRKPLCLSLC